MGEVVTAKLNNVTTMQIHLTEFQVPSEDWINNYLLAVAGQSIDDLSAYGISLQMVQETFGTPSSTMII